MRIALIVPGVGGVQRAGHERVIPVIQPSSSAWHAACACSSFDISTKAKPRERPVA